MTTWRKLIVDTMSDYGETWMDVQSCTLSEDDLDREFDDGFKGAPDGEPFTVWTHDRVYFPVMYDGSEWVASVSRYPDGVATRHIGGGIYA